MADICNQLDAINVPYQLDADIGKRTWYAAGGTATLAHPKSIEQLADIVRCCSQHGEPFYILGAGANLLVRNEKMPGVVIALDDCAFKKIEVVSQDDSKVLLSAGAGCDLFKLVQHTARSGWSGLEAIAGIPGTVGGGITMNAGGTFGDIGARVHSVKTMTREGEIKTTPQSDLEFSYRHTNIKGPVILEATFALAPDNPQQVRQRVKEIFSAKKNSQPMGEASAGCAFKNPPKQTGMAAGQLIDRAGLKGFCIGSATVSSVHANFITLDKQNGSADDAVNLITHIQKVVRDKFNIDLRREVVVWPDDIFN